VTPSAKLETSNPAGTIHELDDDGGVVVPAPVEVAGVGAESPHPETKTPYDRIALRQSRAEIMIAPEECGLIAPDYR